MSVGSGFPKGDKETKGIEQEIDGKYDRERQICRADHKIYTEKKDGS